MAPIIWNYQASFDLLRRDLEQVLEFIEPVDDNATTFSHRTYGLLLRVCTDFESLAKDLLVAAGSRKSVAKMTVKDYRTLEPQLKLDAVQVEFLLWRPQPRRISPFRGWSLSEPTLQWYEDYNVVKHNRNAEFHRASLGVLVEAAAGLFALLAKASHFDWPDCSWSTDNGQYSFCRPPFRMSGPEVG